MLILERKLGERIVIDTGREKITVMVTGVARKKRNGARIGVQAPPHVEVHREEVYDAIQKGRKHE